MPTSTNPTRTVIVCFPAGTHAGWFTASEVVDHHLHAAGMPVHRFPVRHRRLLGLPTRWFGTGGATSAPSPSRRVAGSAGST